MTTFATATHVRKTLLMQRVYADDLGPVLQHPGAKHRTIASSYALDPSILESNVTHADMGDDPWHNRHFYEASVVGPGPLTSDGGYVQKQNAAPPGSVAIVRKSKMQPIVIAVLVVVAVLAAIGVGWFLWSRFGSSNEQAKNTSVLGKVRDGIRSLWSPSTVPTTRPAPPSPDDEPASLGDDHYDGMQDESDTPPLRQPRVLLAPRPPRVSFAPDVETHYYHTPESEASSDNEHTDDESIGGDGLGPHSTYMPPASILPSEGTPDRHEMTKAVPLDANVRQLYDHVGGGGSGGGNQIYGGSETVRALQKAGAGGISAEQAERDAYDPERDPTRDPFSNARRSMASLYQRQMNGGEEPAEPDVTLEELGIRNTDDEYAETRRRSRAMAEASASAVGRIYETVQRQRSGAKDVPFVNPDEGIDYINVHTQQALSSAQE